MLLNKESGSELRIYGCTRAASAALSHCACIVFTVTIALLSRPGTKAILLFSPRGSPLKTLPHKTKSRAHWILQCLCVTCAILGLAAIVYNKHLSGKPHFTSWHGLLGVIAVCAVALQSLAAVPLIYHSLAKGWSLAKLKRYHAATGLVAYLLGSGSLLLGLRSAWFTGSAGEHTWYLAAACCAFNALVVMNQVSSAYTAKKRLQS
uniref:ascorbate ferrireductase (transmembrane) n=1 Tax=Gasterosteus aculeatus aculeatus TaxID=481459 RepID=A0AAQ4RUX7_GASAC